MPSEIIGNPDIRQILNKIRHYLPSQLPLKDFIHHNTLHAFQDLPFHKGLQEASEMFGYQVYLHLDEYRNLYRQHKIEPKILERIIQKKKGIDLAGIWLNKVLNEELDTTLHCHSGSLRRIWKDVYKINLDKVTHPALFRWIAAFLDQGISIWQFPDREHGFLSALKGLEQSGFKSIFQTVRARNLLLHSRCELDKLLEILVGQSQYFEQYLMDQQCAHPGWSGMVSVLEDKPESLLDRRKIEFEDFVKFELILEIDALDHHYKGAEWLPISASIPKDFDLQLKSDDEVNELFEVYEIWQEAYEWTFYNSILSDLIAAPQTSSISGKVSFQGIFCIDDRTAAFRRLLENAAPDCETFGAAGYFNVVFFFQPEHAKFYTRSCPAPMNPVHLIRERDTTLKHEKDNHFDRQTHGIFMAWIITQTIGFWSGLKLAKNIFKPSDHAAKVSSFNHMDPLGKLSIEIDHPGHTVHGLQIGFTVNEMMDRVEGLLKEIGITESFADIVYVIGHGASSVNNTHYAGYDCGACSGRPGSVNARVFVGMANHPVVRLALRRRGLCIPMETVFIAGLHDTTRDEIVFYDLNLLSDEQKSAHECNALKFETALQENALERSRRFSLLNKSLSPAEILKKVRLRSLSLFEPRPEWNHATNACCIVGRREISKHVSFGRRAFMQSYDYRVDDSGQYLLNILKAIAPVCGGINLEYYFSRVDNHRLGAGSKLPHNVVGLIAVSNGMDGDLRPGLPKQMINIHEPLRLVVIVEQMPEFILEVLRQDTSTMEWFSNAWIHLVALHPVTKVLSYLEGEKFVEYVTIAPSSDTLHRLEDWDSTLFETASEFTQKNP